MSYRGPALACVFKQMTEMFFPHFGEAEETLLIYVRKHEQCFCIICDL